jgi:hypothetical protein
VNPPLAEATSDEGVDEVASAILDVDPNGVRMAKVFRQTFDQLYDGQRTGRYSVEQLSKTEKSHYGSLVEINLQRELNLADGDRMDFKIGSHDVDCKFSHARAWMLPRESLGHILLVTHADDLASTWSAGLIRATEDVRNPGSNQDSKTTLNAMGRARIRWLFHAAPLPPNVLLQMEPADVSAIMSLKSGQARVNELFRRGSGRRISRSIIATVAQQDDYMKRVRHNGGARSSLRSEGFVILGGDFVNQRALAVQFGVDIPEPGEMVSARLAPAADGHGVPLAGAEWRLASDDDPPVIAPVIPHGPRVIGVTH